MQTSAWSDWSFKHTFFCSQVSDPIPMKRSKHDDLSSQTPLADRAKQHDWLQSLPTPNKVSVKSGEHVGDHDARHDTWCHVKMNGLLSFADLSFICFRSSSSFLYQTHNQSGEKVQFSFCSPNFLVYMTKPQMFAVTVQKCFKSATSDSFRVWSLNSDWSVLFDFRSTLHFGSLDLLVSCGVLTCCMTSVCLRFTWNWPFSSFYSGMALPHSAPTGDSFPQVSFSLLNHECSLRQIRPALVQMLFPFLFWVDDVLFPLLGRSSTLPSFPHVWMQALTVEPQKWLCVTI